ncbi:CxxxxCH/CxxCH domain c-type cytochrome [Carboxylicivirga marina]|uniref:CxxxxCH/CxxCH domain-containing protein n=1 Tax=Carboxylicivirga marina TaxID=2800988 RepID=A0ABS1HDY0_9BACT|nr:CxxxxCH/CxxCH domain-containing protein [Carboxylicivirga marina]MBK3515875.1 CxxxxCH/CxxCH domain-containing protein [Carboxylicivirga marina]
MLNIIIKKSLLIVLIGILPVINFKANAAKVSYPTSVTGFTGSATYCQNDATGSLTVSFSNCSVGNGQPQNTNITVRWFSNSVNSNSGGTEVLSVSSNTGTTSFNYTPSSSDIGTLYYYVEITWAATASGCGSAGLLVTGTQAVTIEPPAPVQPGGISGTTPVVENTSGITYSISPVADATGYTWTVPNANWLIDAGQNSTSISVTSGNAGDNGDITVTAVNSCGSSIAQTFAVTVEAAPTNPTITLGVNPSVCQGITNADLTYSATTGIPDQYSINFDATAEAESFSDVTNSALAASPITITVPATATPGTYNADLTVRNSGSGLVSDPYAITITVDPPAPATPGAISGSTSVSPTSSGIVYSISSVTYATSYSWTVPVGWTIDSGQGGTSISVSSGTVGQDGDITVTATNSCGTSSSSIVAVTVVAAPPTISIDDANPIVCQGETTANIPYSATSNSPDLYSIGYKGSAPSNGFLDVTDEALTGSPIVLVVPAGAAAGTYNADLTVKNFSTGLSSGIYAITITINATPSAPAISADGATAFCSPGTVTLTSSASSGTYLWSTGATTPSIVVSTSGSYTVTITENACTSPSSAATVVTVSDVPTAPGLISGPTNTTPNSSGNVYSISSVTGADDYTWSVPVGWTINSGQGTTSVSFTSGSEGQNGNITVTANNTCGSSTASVLAVTSSVASSPPTITLSANPSVCQGTTSVGLTYSATTESPDLYSINFSDFAEGQGFVDVVDASLTASPISITVPGGAGVASYGTILSVKNSSTGLSSGNYVFQLDVITTPAIPSVIYGTTNAWPGTTGLRYNVPAVESATSYNWTVPAGWSIESGDGTSVIYVTSGSDGQNGDITVTASNACGTSVAAVKSVVSATPTDHSTTNCTSCHFTHNALGEGLSASTENFLQCQSCHISTGIASNKAFDSSDKAVPGTGGNSHAWDVNAVNTTYETNIPTPADGELAIRVVDGKIMCSTCHDQHNSAAASPYLRVDNTNDVMCKNCHSARNVGRYADDNGNKGSHPVGIVMDTSSDQIVDNPTLAANGEQINCSSCHGVHDVAGGTLTTDGNLLKAANDGTLCLDCHEGAMTHKSLSCLVCHKVHNTNKDNIYMVNDVVNGSTVVFPSLTSFADGDGTYDGICEVCHVDDGTPLKYHRADGSGSSHNDGANCTSCHPHDGGFAPSAGACHSCHDASTPYEYPLASEGYTEGAHSLHVGTYEYKCSTCHFGHGQGGGAEASHPSSSKDVVFDPSGLAAAGGASPSWNGTSCSNVYCHSDGAGTYATVPAWDGGVIACGDCHAADASMHGGTGAHNKHTDGTLYSYNCTTCHQAGHVNGTRGDVGFDLSGLATRNGADANTPSYAGNGGTCSNVYCHSTGTTANRGFSGVAEWNPSAAFSPITYATTPNWVGGSLTTCSACHDGPTEMPAAPNYTIQEGTSTGQVTDVNTTSQYPSTGAHGSNTGAHNSPDQLISLDEASYGDGITHSWLAVQCFWCHNNDAGASSGEAKKQGTYSTSRHVDGSVWFYPSWYGYYGHGEYVGSGKAPAYNTFDTEAECDALGANYVWHSDPDIASGRNIGTMIPGLGYQWSGPTNAHCGNGKNCW